MIHYSPEFSGSVTGTQATVSLSGSFTGSGTIENSVTASSLNFSASFGLGIETFNFDGTSNQTITIDTASAHFITGSIKALNNNTGSFVLTSSISGLTQSFTKGDGTTYVNLLPDTASTDLLYSMSNGLGIESFVFENLANASVQVDTSSFHIANLTASVVISAETSSIRPIDTIVFTQGDSSSFSITQDTSSFVKTVNGIAPDPITGNANTSLTAVSTGTSASMLAASSSGNLDNGEVWIIAGQTGGDPVSGSGSNGESYIFDSGSGQLYKLANTDQAENDVRYVIKSGDTMAGNLILNADPTLALQATTKQYVDPSFVTASVSTGSVGEQVLTFTRLGGGTDVITLFSSSFTQTASFANKVSQSLTQGKGVETFSYNGSTAQTVQVDTASFHVANLTASLLLTASNGLYTMSFTKGDASTFDIPLSASQHADTASIATSASYAVTASYALSASFEIKKETTSSLADTASFVTGSGVYGPFGSNSVISASNAQTASFVLNQTYKENVTGASNYTITHNLGEQYPIVQSYDTATNVMVIPSEVTASNANALDIKFASAFTGIVIVQK